MSISPKLVGAALGLTAVVNVVSGVAAIAMLDLNVTLLLGPDIQFEGLILRHHYIIWLFVIAMGIG